MSNTTGSVRDSRAEGLRIVRPMVRVWSLRSDSLVYLVYILGVAVNLAFVT